jgi:long-chain acyl-CoA synthetase
VNYPAAVGELLSAAAERFGTKPLLLAPDRTVTFAEMDALAEDLCGRLSALGLNRGDRVTLWLENGWRWMVCYFALAKFGAIVNPCNVVLTAAEVLYIANNCKAAAVITSQAQANALEAAQTPELPMPRWLDGGIAESRAKRSSPRQRAQTATTDSVWTIGYTSGTTGRPKGAVLRHSSIVLNTAMTALMHGRTADDIVVSALPCTHVYGNIVMNAAVLQGMTLVLLPRFEEQTVLRAIQEHRATLFEGVPAMYLKLLNVQNLQEFDLTSLRLCTVGGQTMPVSKMEEVESLFGCPLVELWGMTELGGLGTTHPHTLPRRRGSIGIALPMMEAKTVPVESGSAASSPEEIGELLIRGPLVMEGYLGDAEATAAAIDADGWLHTGDLVRRDADGYFYVVDRVKEMILSGGYNVYPAEVERVIALHPAVAMVAVAPMADEVKGQVPKAFVVWKVGTSCTAAEIIAHCRQQLASYKIPRAVEFLQDLPRNSTGKILRRALAAATN